MRGPNHFLSAIIRGSECVHSICPNGGSRNRVSCTSTESITDKRSDIQEIKRVYLILHEKTEFLIQTVYEDSRNMPL
jgi:hypothetical protein